MSIVPRGIRNNNPGNIRHGASWAGMAPQQTDESFVTFIAPEWGIRAIARIMKSYEARGIRTINDAINRWAPPNENNSQAYVDHVCAACSVDQDQDIVLSQHLDKIIPAIIWQENGQQPYDADTIAKGISLA